MPSIKKRSYNSESRQAQATETKSRILTAAQKLFKDEGFEMVTIEKLAQAAEVSAPTIYALFQSKRGVMKALMDEALPSDQRLSLVDLIYKEASPQERLRLTAKLSRQIYDAERHQMELFQGASVLAPEFKELEKEREKRRYERQKEGSGITFADNVLKKGLTLTKARDILWAFTGRDLYRMLVIEQKWSSSAYEKWLTETLVTMLIEED